MVLFVFVLNVVNNLNFSRPITEAQRQQIIVEVNEKYGTQLVYYSPEERRARLFEQGANPNIANVSMTEDEFRLQAEQMAQMVLEYGIEENK